MTTLLVVDDDPAFRMMMEACLHHLGYLSDCVESASIAKDLLQVKSYTMVISDYEMPGETGVDLLEYVAQVYPDLPFIIVTANQDIRLACKAIATGALDFIAKPFEMMHLGRVIEQNLARLRRDQQRFAKLTVAVLEGTIRALVSAVDAKDPHTAQHSVRVMRYALRLGEALELPIERLRVLEFAALLHDVGKISIHEHILTKPGPLDDEEWSIMKQHPIRGAEIVRQIKELAEVAAIIRHHHERWDGGGYPDGLKGEAIPFLARLLTLADVYEAMTAHRSYRSALSPTEASAIIQRGFLSQFDPRVGEVFLKLLALRGEV